MEQHMPLRNMPHRSCGQRGQTLIIMAFLIPFIILLLGLVIDSARLYILAAEAERTAEAGALAGALYMPTYYSTPAPPPDGEYAINRVCEVARQNGVTNCPAATGQVGVTTSIVASNPYELQVTVTLTADTFFLNLISPNLATATISRTAVAQFLPPIQLGSRTSSFGDEVDPGANQSFLARINGPYNLKENGDAFTPTWEEGPTDPINYPDGGSWSYSRWNKTACCTNHQQYGQCTNCPPGPIANPDQHPAGFTGAQGTLAYNYEIVVPPGSGDVKVRIYNPVFDPTAVSGNSNGQDDLGVACDDPKFKIGGACQTGQPGEYLQMTYSLYSAPLPFERSADQLIADSLTNSPPLSSSYDLIPGDITKHNCTGSTNAWDPGAQQCVQPSYFESWYTLATITTPGTYRLAVEATGYYGEHEYSVKLTSDDGITPAAGSRIWAWNDMCVYFTLTNTTSIFDLGEIPAAYAGKTLNFSLFDPGDGSGTINLSILNPNGNAVQVPSWVRTANNDGKTINATGGYYNGLWLHLPITIPANYNPTPGNDWWQIKYYAPNKPNDTITISISLSGSPVHLVSEIL